MLDVVPEREDSNSSAQHVNSGNQLENAGSQVLRAKESGGRTRILRKERLLHLRILQKGRVFGRAEL